jgi:hypothetical protein
MPERVKKVEIEIEAVRCNIVMINGALQKISETLQAFC